MKFSITIFLLFISLLFFQGIFKMVPESYLEGAVVPLVKPDFGWHNWFNGKIQHYAETWLDTNLGFRNFLIRTDNQLNYWLFNEIHQKTGSKIIIGKDNYLYEDNYIDNYLGRDVIPTTKLEERIKKLKQLQDILGEKGIANIFLISPNKAAYHPEYLPENQFASAGQYDFSANYESAVVLLQKYSVNYFDGREYFLNSKEKTKYPLFPKGGTHWSYYGSCLVTEQVMAKIGQQLDKNIVSPQCNDVEISIEPFATDGDLSELSNIWFKDVFNVPLAYPRKVELPAGLDNDIRLLMIGDSFVWNILSHLVFTNGPLVDSYDFYYYFNTNTSYPSEKTSPVSRNSDDLKQAILDHNVLIIETNEAALNDIGFGFVDAALAAFGVN